MEDLFRSYWWLLFPLGFFIAQAFEQVMRYRRHRDTLDLIKTYTEQGREPPQALLDSVTGKLKADAAEDDDEDGDYRAERRRRRYLRRRESGWYQVVLFGVLAAGFGVTAAVNFYPSASGAFLIVTFVMAALCLASLVTVLTGRRD